MSPLPPPLPLDPAVYVPAARATPRQLALALADAMQELGSHFPTLDFAAWVSAAGQLGANLWVEGENEAYYDDQALAQLLLRLEVYAPAAPLNLPRYPEQARYLAKRLVNYQDQAIDALQELEADPLAYGGRVLNLICELAGGNGIAHEVYRATHLTGPDPAPGRRDPTAARAAVYARVEALHRARGTNLHRPLPPAGR